MDRNELALEPRHLGVRLVVFKIIYVPMVRLAQTVPHLCTDTNTISKWIETSFHLRFVT
jgi:hypothetical protein